MLLGSQRTPLLIGIIVIFSVSPAGPVHADWFEIPGFQRQEAVIIDEVHEDKDWITVTFWKIQQDGFVEWESLGSRKSADHQEPKVVKAPSSERQRIVADWRSRGYTAEVTDLDGRATQASNVFVDYDPPSGYQWSVPAYMRKTSLRIVVESNEKEIDFGAISELRFGDGKAMLTLRDGSKVSGPCAFPTFNGKPYRARVYGVQYQEGVRITKVQIPFQRLRSVVFLASKASGAPGSTSDR